MSQPVDVPTSKPKVGAANPIETPEEARALINMIRTNLSTVHHDLNNPLAIISGNAQLLLELARLMKLDDDLIQPIRDIEEASQHMAETLYKLIVLKEMIPHQPK